MIAGVEAYPNEYEDLHLLRRTDGRGRQRPLADSERLCMLLKFGGRHGGHQFACRASAAEYG